MSITKTEVEIKENPIITIHIDDPILPKITKALNSETRRQIIRLLAQEEMDVSQLSKELNQTEANVSAQIKILEKAGLVSSRYMPGGHGVRKVCFNTFKRIEISI